MQIDIKFVSFGHGMKNIQTSQNKMEVLCKFEANMILVCLNLKT